MPVSATQRWQTMFLCRTVKTTGRPLAQAIQPAGDGWSVEVGSDNNKSVYGVGDKNAISLRDNAVIHIKENAVVTNAATRNIGNFGTGANTIEVRSGSKITVDGTVQKYGPQNMGEAINVHGGGNTIVVNGSVIAEKARLSGFRTGQAPAMTAGTASSIMA